MTRLSNIAVVVPLPSVDIDPLKAFDENFFDRAVDNILSEEASIEESRDDMMDNNVGTSSPFGYDGTSDSSKLGVRRSGRTEAKSPHFSTPSISSPTTTTGKKPKSRTSSRIRKPLAMEDVRGNDEAPMGIQNTMQPQHGDEVMEVEPYPIHEAGDHPSALPEATGSTNISTAENEMTAEEKIFVSVDPEKQMEVLKFVVSHPFMMEQVQPVRRSARREFTGQVRGVAAEAGLNDTAIDALIDHIRKTYLEDRGIVETEDAGSAFGDEVDGDAEARKNLHRKRRKSSSANAEDKEHKKSKRRHSDKARRHNHDATQYDERTNVMEAHVPASVPTGSQDNRCIEPDEPKLEDNTPDLPTMPTNIIRGSPGRPIDLTDSPPYDEFIPEADAVPPNEGVGAIGGFKDVNERIKEVLSRSPNDRRYAIPESPSPEKAVEEKPSKRRESSQASKTERNKRKRERKKASKKHRRLGEQKQPQDDSIDGAEKQPQAHFVDETEQDQIPPSTPRRPSFESPNGSTQSSGVTPSDEVQSKYFLGAGNPRVGSKSKREKASSLYDFSIPPKTRQLLKDLNLPPDFLSSDSPLSDAPSDFDSDWNDLEDPPSHIHIKLSPPESPCLCTNPDPETPVKCTSFVNPEPLKTPQAKALKHSPYFPRVLADPESCLPFPPIDASSFGLIQEQLAHDPFRLLIATIFLNRTRGGVALPVLFKVFERYPTIEAMAEADLSEFVSMINCLGFQNQRARKCITLAQTWLSDPPHKSKRYRKLHYPRKLDGRNVGRKECIDEEDLRVAWEIAHLPGVGAYSLDSWRIFCRDELRGKASDWKGTDATEIGFVPEWKCVLPHDKELRAYLTWMWLKEGWVWDYNTGDLTLASDKMMRAAQNGGVAREEEGNWILETSLVKAVNGLHESD
ncbi:hypothetical protein N7519_006112 [Penicillium mononematosum]|uniref:uncharacterized protein n=1 Tax=Penicillium mononematosum TaxID=268346 RepID=UPI0025490C35|nr:uncharacterized protein N7519_006112 [Penicillium mononematosum]KAJ6184811.1 hypothetical protein N7519_006112 [Penicillium mononematosum]